MRCGAASSRDGAHGLKTAVPLRVLAGLVLGAIRLVALVPMVGMRARAGGWKKTTAILSGGNQHQEWHEGTERDAPNPSGLTKAPIEARSRMPGR